MNLEELLQVAEMKKNFIQTYPMIFEDSRLDFLETENKVFSVFISQLYLYPAFQLDENRNPYPVIEEILHLAHARHIPNWTIAFWFVTPCNLDSFNRCPKDIIQDSELVKRLFLEEVEG